MQRPRRRGSSGDCLSIFVFVAPGFSTGAGPKTCERMNDHPPKEDCCSLARRNPPGGCSASLLPFLIPCRQEALAELPDASLGEQRPLEIFCIVLFSFVLTARHASPG